MILFAFCRKSLFSFDNKAFQSEDVLKQLVDTSKLNILRISCYFIYNFLEFRRKVLEVLQDSFDGELFFFLNLEFISL